jgi:hypothetical protein
VSPPAASKSQSLVLLACIQPSPGPMALLDLFGRVDSAPWLGPEMRMVRANQSRTEPNGAVLRVYCWRRARGSLCTESSRNRYITAEHDTTIIIMRIATMAINAVRKRF